jgi:sugar/nucleoside kinase (ribokinase family)
VSARPAIAVGDVFVDYVCDLSQSEVVVALDGPVREQDLFAPVSMEIGGGGAQFAVAARRSGFDSVGLIGKVGGAPAPDGGIRLDPLAQLAAEFLAARDVVAMWAVDPDSATGRACIVYGPGDRRLMVSDPGANATLSRADVAATTWQAVERAALVHVSGYVLLQPERRAAAMGLMRAARRYGTTVAVDVAPHDIHKFIGGPVLLDTLAPVVDWIMVALPTAHRLLGHGSLGEVSVDVADKVLDVLRDRFPSVALSINPSLTLVHHRGKREERRFEYVPGIWSRGQSAAVQAQILGGFS